MKTLLPLDYSAVTLLPFILDKIPQNILETETDSNYDDILDCTIRTENGSEFLQLEVLENVWIDILITTSNGEDLDIELQDLTYFSNAPDVHFEIETREDYIIKKRITELTTIN